ncbi:24291_t:CDS:1, partial [Racocetra persica]
SLSQLLNNNGLKKHNASFNAMHDYYAETYKEYQWYSTRFTPLSVATMWFFGSASSFSSNTIIGKIQVEYTIEYEEIAINQVDVVNDDNYEFFGS